MTTASPYFLKFRLEEKESDLADATAKVNGLQGQVEDLSALLEKANNSVASVEGSLRTTVTEMDRLKRENQSLVREKNELMER